jgi:signal transduction histidine kinase/FixJ family two-component response regulator
MADASIIIIDDEKGIAQLCQRLLERAKYRVKTFTDPVEGVKALRLEQFDLLLVDIRMPGMDGFQVIEEGRKGQPDIAVVIMTGCGTLEAAIRALRQGADGLILKPFEETGELVNTVREALKERQHKQEMARLRTIRPLLDITESLFTETRYEALLDLVLKAICGHLRCSHSAIYQRKPGENYLHLIGQIGNALPEEHARASSGLVGRADHWKVPIMVNLDSPGDLDLQSILKEHHFGAVICIPVERREGSLVFMAGRDIDEPGFQLVDLELFGLLARQADVAFENARLYGELRGNVRQIEESQRALIQAEKMSAVGRLTASIAHEVNNPLQSVRNCLHLAGRKEMSEDERENYQKLAEDELDRLMSTVQRMLDFYRPGTLSRTPTDVAELIRRVLDLLEKQLSGGGVIVEEDIATNLPPVNVVSNQIQQVFFNITLNAMEAMKEGGVLGIKARSVNDNIEITFQDNGPGVPEDLRDKIFEPFISLREDGTGLGLSVSYGILTAHGGSLELESSNSQGACFKVFIPVKEA